LLSPSTVTSNFIQQTCCPYDITEHNLESFRMLVDWQVASSFKKIQLRESTDLEN